MIDRFQHAGGNAAVRTLHLAPPTYPSSRWKAQEVRDLVSQVLYPVVVPATPGEPAPGTTALPSLVSECGVPVG